MATVLNRLIGAFLALALAGPAAAQTLLGDADAAPTGAEISVLTYNVHGLPWPFAKRRGHALQKIGEELARMRAQNRQPDIVLIQEGFVGGVADLIRLSGYRYSAAGPQRADRADTAAAGRDVYVGGRHIRYVQKGEGWGKWTGAGLYVLSDHPIVDVKIQPYKSCAGWDCLANKGAMMVRIALPGAPTPIDVVNTHMNSRGAAKVPRAWSMQAYSRQAQTLESFIARHREAGAPLLMGGDFNVRNAPDRFASIADARPYQIVSRWCAAKTLACGPKAKADHDSPWLDSQDQQGFAAGGPVSVLPVRSETLFDGAPVARLSDHPGYLVRYWLDWSGDGAVQPFQIAGDDDGGV